MKIARSILFATLCLAASLAQSATFTVSSLADSGAGSLRNAITQANSAAGAPHVIAFQPGLSGTITLASEIRISNSMSINGPGATLLTLDGADSTRLLRIERTSGAPRSVTISGLRFIRGFAESGGAIYAFDDDVTILASIFSENGASFRGGAIFLAEADLTLDGVSIIGNHAPSTGQGSGGGILFSAGTLTVARSYIAQNTANFGAGMSIVSPRAHAVITDTLIQDNIAGHTGGGIQAGTMSSFRMSGSALVGNFSGQPLGGGLYLTGSNDPAAGAAIIENTTFSGNVSRHPSGQASALAASGGNLIVRNSTFALNATAPTTPPVAGLITGALWVDSTATTVRIESTLFDSNTHGNTGVLADLAHVASSASNPSIVSATDSLFRTMPGASEINGDNLRNQFATSAQLKPLTTADGGGFVPVHPLARTSPAIDRGSNPGGLIWDQRGAGFVRAWSDPGYRNDPLNSHADIGAFEYRGDAFFHGDFEQR